MIDVLAASDIKKQDKLRFDFAVAKNNLEMERVGYSIARNKLVVLPMHFALKSEQDFTTDFAERLKAAYPRLAKLDLSKLKEMFILSPEELRFAMLCEITKANWDYIVVDSSMIGTFAYVAMNLIYYIPPLSRMRAGAQYTLATLLWAMSVAVYFYYRDRLFDIYCDYSLKDTFDLDLVEGGLHYLNKQIQLNRLLGKDASDLERRLAKFKMIYEELKAEDQKQDELAEEEDEDSDEDEEFEDSDDEDGEESRAAEKANEQAKPTDKTKEQAKREEIDQMKNRLKKKAEVFI